LYLAVENIDHSRTKTKSPQTNGICERFYKTALNEFYRVAFRKKVYRSTDELQADLDAWIKEYNEARSHQGRWCFGPMQTFLDAMPIAKEKMIAAYGNGDQNLIAQPGTSCPIEFRLVQLMRTAFTATRRPVSLGQT
jgi:Integrase core domain